MALNDAIDWITAQLQAIDGIRLAPKYPTDQVFIFPFAAAWDSAGTYTGSATPGQKKGLHTIVVELHVARNDLEVDVEVVRALRNTVIDVLMKYPRLNNNVDHNGEEINYTFGALGWGGFDTIGYRITLDNVKVLDTITDFDATK